MDFFLWLPRLLLQSLFNSLMSRFVSHDLTTHHSLNIQMDKELKKEGTGTLRKAFRIQTPDGCILEGSLFTPKNWSSHRPTIIRCNGFGDVYQNGGGKDLSHLSCRVICFNFRGTGMSSGEFTPSGIVLDTLSVYQYAQNKLEIHPRNLHFYGHSLGAVAAEEACQRLGAPGSVILDRTFGDMVDVFVGHFPWLGYVMDLFARCLGWDLHLNTPNTKQETRRRCLLRAQGDLIIPERACATRKCRGITAHTLTPVVGSHLDPHTAPLCHLMCGDEPALGVISRFIGA